MVFNGGCNSLPLWGALEELRGFVLKALHRLAQGSAMGVCVGIGFCLEGVTQTHRWIVLPLQGKYYGSMEPWALLKVKMYSACGAEGTGKDAPMGEV